MSPIKGICTHFCPTAEAKMRTKEKLLHFFELSVDDATKPGILIKCFARSAAGTRTAKPADLRTKECLQQTIEYLLSNILQDERKSFKMRYDFVFDRLRAVRQEIVVQNFNEKETIEMLQPIIMFLAYSRYRLCEEPIENFDAKICEQHLQECLKRVLCCYDHLMNALPTKNLSQRCFFESLYQLFNIGSVQTLQRALTLPRLVRQNAQFNLCFNMAISLQQGNLYRILKGMQQLPHILCAILSLKLQMFRCKLLKTFAAAYNSKQLVVPVDFVQNLANYERPQLLWQDCKHYGLQLNAEKNGIQFQKNDFKADAPIRQARHEKFVEQKLQRIQRISQVLLLVKL